MSLEAARRISEGPAVPLSVTVLRSGGAWVVQVWYHGTTVHEALHPVLVQETVLDVEVVRPSTAWSVLWHHVALTMLELADGKVSAHYSG